MKENTGKIEHVVSLVRTYIIPNRVNLRPEHESSIAYFFFYLLAGSEQFLVPLALDILAGGNDRYWEVSLGCIYITFSASGVSSY